MANNVTSNPLVIDTAGAAAIITHPIRILAFLWDAGASAVADNTVVVQDKNSLPKFSATALTKDVNLGLTLPQSIPSHGLIVPTLAAGTLYIYLE